VICGTPIPATTLVVQIDPGPTPTLTASTPASIKSLTAEPVATLPATKSMFGNVFFNSVTFLITPWEWPCAVSTTKTSTPDLKSL